jgi:ferredoxin
MPRLTIDNQAVQVPAGSSILDAARKLGIDIPSLCYHDGYRPETACMLCLVRVGQTGRLLPSCATPAEDGMEVQSETPEIAALRRAGLELLLSDHAGDCVAPCQTACPAKIDLPAMLRQVAAGDWGEAIVTIRRDLALPAVLGRVCDDYCEKACRRAHVDSPAAICAIKRFVADRDLATGSPCVPSRAASSGKSVAVVGSGPAGLSAAYHLLIAGHACTIFDQRPEAGGQLRYEIGEDRLPRDVLDAEIAIIVQLGAKLQLNTCVGREISLDQLREQFDAVLLTVGPVNSEAASLVWDRLEAGPTLRADPATHETRVPGVFAAGDAVRSTRIIVRAVADGKSAASSIHEYLTTGKAAGEHRPFAIRMGRLDEHELVELTVGASRANRIAPSDPKDALTAEQAQAEAARCLHCDCSAKDGCRLRRYAAMYEATATRYRGRRRMLERRQHAGDIVYEPGKCILCGLCVQAAEAAGEQLGLTFIGRGFDVRVGVPFDRPLTEALRQAAQACVEVCPSGAIVRAEGDACGTCGTCQNA